jgi:hypothetical protein
MKGYVLPWLIHLVGDIEQPSHALPRFDRYHPNGDRGGNAIEMKSCKLHSYWDSRVGTGETDRFLNQLTATIQGRHPKPSRLDMNPERWAKEGYELRNQVYTFTGNGTGQSPPGTTQSYEMAVIRIQGAILKRYDKTTRKLLILDRSRITQ